jgi:hypothetical protein
VVVTGPGGYQDPDGDHWPPSGSWVLKGTLSDACDAGEVPDRGGDRHGGGTSE